MLTLHSSRKAWSLFHERTAHGTRSSAGFQNCQQRSPKATTETDEWPFHFSALVSLHVLLTRVQFEVTSPLGKDCISNSIAFVLSWRCSFSRSDLYLQCGQLSAAHSLTGLYLVSTYCDSTYIFTYTHMVHIDYTLPHHLEPALAFDRVRQLYRHFFGLYNNLHD